ncbi:MAG: FIST C-terminal domain-containing protein [bacterium]|nr:FIST C-terminal domain-containing protein [bacterium]
MKTHQLIYRNNQGWNPQIESSSNINPQLILLFGSTELIKANEHIRGLKEKFPNAIIVGGSSSGEICGIHVYDDTIVATLVEFKSTTVQFESKHLLNPKDSKDVAIDLIGKLDKKDLKHIFFICEGLNINGSELAKGIRSALPQGVAATGGLAGDGANFNETFVLNSDGKAETSLVSAIGFYGEKLLVSYGSLGGWDSFGIERLVTRSVDNVLYEVDGMPALELYKSFLGDYVKDLPASGLLFPINLRNEEDDKPVVRTILAVNEEMQSLTFAGDIPEGSYIKLMKANFDRLIEGATGAALSTIKNDANKRPELAILISCVGRKLVLKQLIEDEVESVSEVLGEQATLCGFYSYGEISPFDSESECKLHNQTMTITTFKEMD